MKKFLLVMLTLSAMILFTGQAAAEPAAGPWKLVMDKNGIKAYQRSIEGTSIHEIRAVTVVDATLENIGEVLRDVPANNQWLPYCEEAHTIEMRDRNDQDLYVLLDLPWPVSNRDLVVSSKAHYDLDRARAIVDIQDVCRSEAPPVDGNVRIPSFSGVYVFEYISRQRTGIIYTYRVDMGGYIPAKVLNFLGKFTLYDTFTGLRKMVAKDKYIQAGLRSPDRKICEDILASGDSVREIFKNRLDEFVGDKEFIETVAADQDILDAFFSARPGSMAEILLYGWGSADSKKKAIRALLAAHLEKSVKDPAQVRKMVDDEEIVNAILTGNGSARKLITARLGS
ncbi:MAG: START domain-containing protein [Proteobacteria bacterium]|nr:START domain-containing protein [Pseudomonadota bacterium]